MLLIAIFPEHHFHKIHPRWLLLKVRLDVLQVGATQQAIAKLKFIPLKNLYLLPFQNYELTFH